MQGCDTNNNQARSESQPSRNNNLHDSKFFSFSALAFKHSVNANFQTSQPGFRSRSIDRILEWE